MGAFKGILEAFVMFAAEQERTNIAKRTSGGRSIKAANSLEGAPFGYMAKDRQLVVVPRRSRYSTQDVRYERCRRNVSDYRRRLTLMAARARGGKFPLP